MSKPHRAALVVLAIAGFLVLLGQLWPGGAPPFARAVNIGFAAGAVGYFMARLAGRA